MQIVQVLFGVQLCPISVKVTWAKLFPDDAHDDIDEGEDNVQLPMQIALSTGALPTLESAGKPGTDLMGSFNLSPPGTAPTPGGAGWGGASPGGPGAKPGMLMHAASEDDGAGDPSIDVQMQRLTSSLLSIPSPPPSATNSVVDPLELIGRTQTVAFNTGGHLNPMVDPIDRVEMKAAPNRPENPGFVSLRQRRDTLDAFHMSPIMQQ